MRRLVPIIAAGFIAASLLTWAFGDSGLRAAARLERYRDGLAANVESLRARNAALEAELRQLREDPAANEVLARELGLYRPGDRVLRVEGLAPRPRLYSVGTLLRRRSAGKPVNPWLTVAGIGVSAGLFAASAILRRRGARGRLHTPRGARRQFADAARRQQATGSRGGPFNK
jgi:cell division protein FtsB